MDECLDSLGQSVLISSLDCNWGYSQIPIHPKDIVKTTFTSHFVTFMYKRRVGLLDLKTPHDVSERCLYCLIINEVSGFSVYIDDIIVFSRTFDHHFGNLSTVLSLMRNTSFSLMMKKCFFLLQTRQFATCFQSARTEPPTEEARCRAKVREDLENDRTAVVYRHLPRLSTFCTEFCENRRSPTQENEEDAWLEPFVF